jgi:hypothetical protein
LSILQHNNNVFFFVCFYLARKFQTKLNKKNCFLLK